MLQLVSNAGTLKQLYSFLSTFLDWFIKSFCITTQASKWVKISVFITKQTWLELWIAVVLCLLNFVIENFDVFSVQNLYITSIEFRHLAIVKLSGFILEEAVTFADAATVSLGFWLTRATRLTIKDWFVNSVWEFKQLFMILMLDRAGWPHMCVVKDIGWTV